MGRIFDWLTKPPPAQIAEHSSLASLVVSTKAQQLWRQQSQALAVASVFRARMMNADTLASLPVKAGDSLLPAPNDSQDTYDFVAQTVLSMQDTGDAYWRKYANGDLRVLDPAKMNVQWNKDETQRVYNYDGRRMRAWGIDPPLYVLSMNRGVRDLVGFGPMQSGRIAGIVAAQKYVQEFYENQAQATGNLKHPGVLTEEEAKALVEVWEAGQAQRGTGVLSGGLEYERSGFSPTDAQWVEGHLVDIGDVANLFGIPSYLLNYNQPGSTLTYTNVGDIYQAYWRMTLKPTYARRIEAAWSSATGSTVRFDPEELFLASMNTRVSSAVMLTQYGYEPAEVLDALGIPPIGHTGQTPVTLQPEDTNDDPSI